MEIQVVAGPGAGRRYAVGGGAAPRRVLIGRDPRCGIVVHDPDVARRHAEIDLGGRTVRDLASRGGTALQTLDGAPPQPVGLEARQWPDGVLLVVGAGRLALRRPAAQPRAAVHRDGAGRVLVNRAPRLLAAPESATLDYPNRPVCPAPARMPWAMALLPLLVAVPMALLWHQPAFLLFAVLSPLAALGQYLLDRRSRAAGHGAAVRDYLRECSERDQELAGHVGTQCRRRHHEHPDLAHLAGEVAGVGGGGPGGRLWERSPDHADQFSLRLGLADLPAEVTVRRDGRTEVPVLPGVPLAVDLGQTRVLGVCGPRAAREALARSLLGQLALACSPREVHLTVLGTDPGGTDRTWGWTNRLPHAGRPRPDAVSVTLLDTPDRLRRHPQVASLLAAEDGLAVCLARIREQLPQECTGVVQLADGAAARAVLHRSGHRDRAFAADLPDVAWAEGIAAALAGLRDATAEPAGSALPRAVALLDLVSTDPAAIGARWLEPDDGRRLVAPLGRTSGGTWVVDLVRDGPHALVAGTTGAGKSELLTTLVASLATAYPPDRLAFLLVDYKGGTAFAHLAGLPHVTGVITDLDAALARRALTSLRAELRRREAWLGGAAGRTAGDLPRLVIVVDEFRVLAEEQPDLLAGLVRVATVGRGLGVHLVLATQRPSGAVSADIKANANLRIALRLRERADSDDVVDAPDAARIEAGCPGRAVVVAGSEEPITVQTAHLPPTDRDRWLATVQAAATLIGARTPPAPWLPPLPDRVGSADLGLRGGGLGGEHTLPYALADLPAEQRRAVLGWDLVADGHLAVVGGPGSGRSTMLRTLAAVAGRVGGIHVHVIDAAAGLVDLADPRRHPHVGTVVTAHDAERGDRLVAALAEEVRRRRSSAGRIRGVPPLILLVDGWESLVETWSRRDHGRGVEDLLRLARDGMSVGVRLAVSGGRSLLGGAVAATFSTRLLLPSADPHHGLLAGVPPDRLPRHWPPGRVLHLGRGTSVVEAQVAQVTAEVIRPPDAPDPAPLRLLPLPDHLDRAALFTGNGTSSRRSRAVALIGVGGDQALPVGFALHGSPGGLVCGPPGAGRSAALATLSSSLRRAGRPVVLVAPRHLDWDPGPGVVPFTGRGESTPELDPGAVLLLDTGWSSVPGLDDLAVRHLNSGGEDLRVVAAAATSDVVVAFRGLLAELRGLRTGLLLGPRSAADAEALGVRAPAAPDLPPGRGLLVHRGRGQPVQVAVPASAAGGVGGAFALPALCARQ